MERNKLYKTKEVYKQQYGTAKGEIIDVEFPVGTAFSYRRYIESNDTHLIVIVFDGDVEGFKNKFQPIELEGEEGVVGMQIQPTTEELNNMFEEFDPQK